MLLSQIMMATVTCDHKTNDYILNFDSSFICERIIREMPQIETASVSTIEILCWDKLPKTQYSIVLSDVTDIWVEFDYNKYRIADYTTKVNMIFDALEEGIEYLCNFYMPEIRPLLDLVHRIRSTEIKNDFIYKKKKITKNLFLEIYVDNQMYKTLVFVVCKDNEGIVLKKEQLAELNVIYSLFIQQLEKIEISYDEKCVILPNPDTNSTRECCIVSFADLIGDDKIIMPRKRKKKVITADTSFLEEDRCKAFWKTMELCDWDKEGDDEQVLEPLVQHLSEQSDDEIFEFHDAMALLLRKLDTDDLQQVYKKHSGYFSEDDFLDSRCVALINGEEIYCKAIIGEFDYMWNAEFESLLYVPENAWARKHGALIEDYPHETGI